MLPGRTDERPSTQLPRSTGLLPLLIHSKVQSNFATATNWSQIPNVFLHNPSLHNFDPRFGLAYNPFANHKTSIRAGFGIFHDPITAQDYQTGFGVAPAWNIAQQIAPANIQLRMGSEYRYDSNVVLRFAGDASRSQRWSRLRPPGSTRVSPALVWTLIVWYSQTPSSGCPDSPNRCPCCP